ncbi:VOC family protein [Arthrobacter sp. NPDC055585]
MDWKIELVPVPVSNVDASKHFYVDQVGFTADHDHRVDETLRFVQLTPPGSACSVVIGDGTTDMVPGSQRIQIVVPSAADARQHLLDGGVQASDVTPLEWGTFVYFSDPDGNQWSLQEMPAISPI